jgi:hypothetical protein
MSSIGYLAEVRQDLLDAGTREYRRRRGRSAVGFRDRFSMKSIVAVTSVVTLLAAGTLGWFMTKGDGLYRTISGGEDEGNASRAPSADHQTIREGELSVPEGLPAPEYVRFDSLFAGSYVPSLIDEVQGGPSASAAILPELSRVIRTAELGLVIPPDSFDDRFARVIDVATDNGGFVATSTSRERSGNVTMRVPADNFTQTLQDLRALGGVEVQTIQGRDVTAEYVDLRARLRITKSRREVLLRLMDRATSIEQTIRVQNALDETQLRIEEFQGQLRFLDNRTSLATIQVHLREEGVEIPAEVDTPSIPTAFERSVAGFVGVIAGVVIGLGYLIPIALLAALIWFVWTRIRVRRRAA